MKTRIYAKVEYTFPSVIQGWKIYCDEVYDWEQRDDPDFERLVNDLAELVDPIVSYLDKTYPGPVID